MGRSLRNSNTNTAEPEPETVQEAVIAIEITPADTQSANVEPAAPETPPTQADEGVAVVDLTTPHSSAASRPVEVDLTCELDDEVFVVLV